MSFTRFQFPTIKYHPVQRPLPLRHYCLCIWYHSTFITANHSITSSVLLVIPLSILQVIYFIVFFFKFFSLVGSKGWQLIARTNSVVFLSCVARLYVIVYWLNILYIYLTCSLYLYVADPPEHRYLYAIPAASFLGGYALMAQAGSYPDIHQMTYLAASLCCVGALTGLSSQKTSRIGNLLGMIGVSSGIAATLGFLKPSPELATQMAACMGSG